MKVVNKNFVMRDFVYKCNASLPCTCHILDCSYVESLQYNFTISDHSEPIVPYGVMADWLFSAWLWERYCTDCVILAAYIIALKNIS